MQTRIHRSVLAPVLLVAISSWLACKSDSNESPPAPENDAGQDVVDAPIEMASVGEDLDIDTPRDLSSTYALPKEYFAAVTEVGLKTSDLTFPDLGLTFDKEPTRLHWTDEIRHDGSIAPVFAAMAADEVKKAVALGDSATTARELIATQGMFGDRDKYVLRRFDRKISVPVKGGLLAALRTYYEHARVAGDPNPDLAPWSDLEASVAEQVDRFSPKAQIAIAQCILGLLAAAELRDKALSNAGVLTVEQWGPAIADYWKTRGSVTGHTRALELSKAMDFGVLAKAGQLAVRSVESLRIALKGEPPVDGARLDLQGPLGRIAIALDGKDDSWASSDFFLLVDLGGNDTYLDDVATNKDVYHPISVVLDLAGNDTYKPSFAFDIKTPPIPAVKSTKSARQAAGFYGIAVLDDAAGDDSYHSPRFAQGYALFGVGVLLDHGGADLYRGYDNSQGSAEYGYALLFDSGASKDKYETWELSEGFGGTRGIGFLVDDGGNDEYLAIEDPIISDWAGEGTNWSGSMGFGFGTRLSTAPYLSGGLGALFDLGGDDKYQCAVMCQGFGYFFGAGVFWDESGNDDHIVTHKYGIGGATHQSIGVFMDGQGADKYTYLGHGSTGGGEGVGLGYDLGVAFHIDRGNEADIYSFPVDIGWVMGFARHPALGVLINEGGDDEYHVTGKAGATAFGTSEVFDYDRTAGIGTLKTPSLGMFLDLGGKKDVYDLTHVGSGNAMKWIQTTPVGAGWKPELDHGYGLDTE